MAALALLGSCAAGMLLAHSLPPALSAPLASSVPVGREPVAVAVDSRAGRVFVANYDDASVTVLDAQPQGHLYVLDGRTGRTLRTAQAGDAPVAIAVDSRARHAFVVNQTPADAPSASARSHRILTWARRWLPWLPLPWPPRGHATGSVRIVDLQRRA